MRPEGRNCMLVQKTGISPFRRCQYCELRTVECFGLQFFAVVTAIIMLIVVMFTVRDLPTLAFDIAFLILLMVVFLEFIANRETNEVVVNNQLLKDLNLDLENRVTQRTKELKLLNLELQKAIRTKSDFLRNINHDLRSPLTGMIGFASILEEKETGELNEKQHKFISSIKRNGHELLGLINQLLELSKLESNKVEENKKEFDIKKAIEDSIVSTEYMATKKDIRLSVAQEPKVSYVFADPDHVKQVLVNLLNNAIKFTGSGGSVSVEIKEDADIVFVSVKDTGTGIPKEDLKRIFEPFTQVENDISKQVGGIGIGLSIVKSFVEASGGTITVDSEMGMGSVFTFSLPKKMK